MKSKNRQFKAKKKKDLKLMVDSFMRSMTTAPSFDLRATDASRSDRSRSTGVRHRFDHAYEA